MTRVLLADDHRLVRQGFRALLEPEPDFELIGEESNGIELLRRLEQRQPDVLVLDVALPGLNGLDVAREVAARFPDVKVCMLSMYADEAYVVRALNNGALGYIVKSADAADFVRGLRQVAAGRRYLSPPLTERSIEAYAAKVDSSEFDVYETLTGRERQVLQLAAEGLTSAEIGERLFISPRTVESHRAEFNRKLGIRNRTELVRFAMERGIVAWNRFSGPETGQDSGPEAQNP